MELAHLLYFVAAFFCGAIALLFYRTRDGMERKIMIWIFGTISVSLCGRAVSIILPHDVYDYYNNLISVMVITPVAVSTAVGFFLLYNKYFRQAK